MKKIWRNIFSLIIGCTLLIFPGCNNSSVALVTTTDANNINATAATTGGEVVWDGGASVTERGICWSTTQYPLISDNKITNSGGIGVFSHTIAGLVTNRTYYVRAYAINSAGTSYGNQIVFSTGVPSLATLTTTATTNISQTIATVGGTITYDGGSAVTERGVCWNTSNTPTTSNNKITNGTGTGSFTCGLNSLQIGTTYYARAFATNSVGTVYGNEVTFSTNQPSLPTITTAEAISITANGATLGGNVTADGGSIVTERGVCLSTSAAPTTSNIKMSSGTGTGSFTCVASSLVTGTTYHARAYATNLLGTVYGNEITFIPSSISFATITTTAATAITTTTATVGGNITADGGASVTQRGICWGTTTLPTINNSNIPNGIGTGSFSCSLGSLLVGTTYYARAFAINSVGISYGNEVTFTTTATPANNTGTLTVSFTTSTANGKYKPANISAAWVKTSAGVFVKTLLVYAASRKNDLTNWSSNTGKNATNAITGATKTNYLACTCTWNATDVNNVVVANGDYIVCLEMSDGILKYYQYTFTKGATAVSMTPANVTGFTGISINWVPN